MKRKQVQRLVAEAAEYGVTEAECRELAPWAFRNWPEKRTAPPARPLPLPEDVCRRYTPAQRSRPPAAFLSDATAALAEYALL